MKNESIQTQNKGLLTAALLIQINIGSLYAWNIISSMLIDTHGFSAGVMGFVYGVTLLAFTGSMIPVGRLLHSFSPRRTLLVALALYGAGMILTSLSNGNLLLVFLGHGVFVGLATGIGYVSSTTYGLLPFERKSIPMGLIVAAFGLGSIWVTKVVEILGDREVEISTILIVLAVVQVLIMLPALFLVPNEPFGEIAPLKKEETNHSSIAPLVVAMFAATFGGLLIISNIKQITLPLNSAMQISLTLILFSLGNGLSRVVFGLFQFMNYARIIVINMVLFTAFLVLMKYVPTVWGINLMVFGMGVLFGSFFVLFPMVVVQSFGQRRFPQIYPKIFLAYGVAATVSAPLGGKIYDTFQHPQIALMIAAVIEFVGALILMRFFTAHKSSH